MATHRKREVDLEPTWISDDEALVNPPVVLVPLSSDLLLKEYVPLEEEPSEQYD